MKDHPPEHKVLPFVLPKEDRRRPPEKTLKNPFTGPGGLRLRVSVETDEPPQDE